MEPTQPTNPMPPGGTVDPNQASGSIEFPAITVPTPPPEPTPTPSPTPNQPLANPFNPTTSITNDPLNTASTLPSSPTATPGSSVLDPIAFDPIPPSNGTSRFKIPFPAIIIGLIVLVILIVILSLTVTNSVKPTTQTVNNGSTSQTPP